MRIGLILAVFTVSVMGCKGSTPSAENKASRPPVVQPATPPMASPPLQEERYTYALASDSPGPGWELHTETRPPSEMHNDIRAMFYHPPGKVYSFIIAADGSFYRGADGAPAAMAAKELANWKGVFPGGTFTKLEVAPDGHYATFAFSFRNPRQPVMRIRQAFVRLPGAKSLVYVNAHDHNVEDGVLMDKAFRVILNTLRLERL